MTMIRSLLRPTSSLALALLASAPAMAQDRGDLHAAEDAQLRAAKERYAFSEWPRGPRRLGLDLQALRFDGRSADEIRVLPSGLVTRSYPGSDGRSPIRLEFQVLADARAAHQWLLERVAFVSSRKTLPTTASEGAAIGDQGYVGHSGAAPGAISWIAWVDGNVAARLCCNDPRRHPATPMIQLAEQISAEIRRGPELSADSVLSAPEIRELSLGTARCKAGDELDLQFSAQDPHGPLGHFQWRILGDAQGYVEEDEAWRLTTTGPGEMKLELTVLGRYGVPVRRVVELSVEDED